MAAMNWNVTIALLSNETRAVINSTRTGPYEDSVMTTQDPQGVNGSLNNGTVTEKDEYHYLFGILIFLYSTLWFFCVVGNSFVLMVMRRSPLLRARTSLVLCHLAVADLSVGLVCIIPNLVAARYLEWIPGSVGWLLCKFYNFFKEFIMTVSVLLLVLIAVERYVAILHPLKVKRLFTKLRMHSALAMVWLTAGLYNMPLFLIYDTLVTDTATYCFRKDSDNQAIRMKAYVMCSFLMTYVLPLILMVVLYIRISVTLWRSRAPGALRPGEPIGGGLYRGRAAPVEIPGEVAANADTNRAEQRSCRQDSTGAMTSAPDVGNTGGTESRSGRNSCTSRTSCSFTGSVSTSNTLVSDHDPSCDHGRHDNVSLRPALRACRSDPSRLTEKDTPAVKFQRIRHTMCDCASRSYSSSSSTTTTSSSSTSRFQRHSTSTSTNEATDNDSSRSVFYPTLAEERGQHSGPAPPPSSISAAIPLMSPPPSSSRVGGGRGGGGSSSPAAPQAPAACPSSYSSSAAAVSGVAVSRNSRRHFGASSLLATSHQVLRTRRKAARLLIVLVGTFALCVLPFHLRMLLWYWLPEEYLWHSLWPKCIAQVMFFLNSALNPVLYSLMLASFRRIARQVLCCGDRGQRHDMNMAAFGAEEARAHHMVLNRQAAQRVACLDRQ